MQRSPKASLEAGAQVKHSLGQASSLSLDLSFMAEDTSRDPEFMAGLPGP